MLAHRLDFTSLPPLYRGALGLRATSGRLAQRESTPFTRVGSQVQSLHRPPSNLQKWLDDLASLNFANALLKTLRLPASVSIHAFRLLCGIGMLRCDTLHRPSPAFRANLT